MDDQEEQLSSPHLSDKVVELLLGFEPLDLLVYPLVLLQLLQIGPATVEVRTGTKRTNQLFPFSTNTLETISFSEKKRLL